MFLSRRRNVSKKRRFRSVLAAPPSLPPPCAGDCSISLSCFSGRLTRFLPSANNQVPRGGGGGKDGGGGRQWPHNSLPFVPHRRRRRPAVAPKASFTSCEVGGPSGSLPPERRAGPPPPPEVSSRSAHPFGGSGVEFHSTPDPNLWSARRRFVGSRLRVGQFINLSAPSKCYHDRLNVIAATRAVDFDFFSSKSSFPSSLPTCPSAQVFALSIDRSPPQSPICMMAHPCCPLF